MLLPFVCLKGFDCVETNDHRRQAEDKCIVSMAQSTALGEQGYIPSSYPQYRCCAEECFVKLEFLHTVNKLVSSEVIGTPGYVSARHHECQINGRRKRVPDSESERQDDISQWAEAERREELDGEER